MKRLMRALLVVEIDPVANDPAGMPQGLETMALDHTAMAAEPIVALDALASDAVLDPAAPEVSAASRIVVALVRMQFFWPAACSATLAAHSRQGIEQFLEDRVISN